jgi:hypothetical protein
MDPSPQLVLKAVAFGALVPAAVTLAVAAAWLWRGRRPGDRPPEAEGAGGDGVALAAGVGLTAGWVALAGSGQLGWEFLKPTDSWHWLLPLSLLALAAGVGERRSPARAVSWPLRLAVAGLTAWLLIRAEAAVQPVRPGWYAGLGGAVLALWGLLDAAARRRPGWELPALLTAVAVGAAIVLERADFLFLAQLAGVLAAVLGGCALLAWYRPATGPAQAVVPAVAVSLPGLMFAGYFNHFSEVPAASFLLVTATPLVLAATAWLPHPERTGWRPTALRAGITLVPLGVAVALAAWA